MQPNRVPRCLPNSASDGNEKIDIFVHYLLGSQSHVGKVVLKDGTLHAPEGYPPAPRKTSLQRESGVKAPNHSPHTWGGGGGGCYTSLRHGIPD